MRIVEAPVIDVLVRMMHLLHSLVSISLGLLLKVTPIFSIVVSGHDWYAMVMGHRIFLTLAHFRFPLSRELLGLQVEVELGSSTTRSEQRCDEHAGLEL